MLKKTPSKSKNNLEKEKLKKEIISYASAYTPIVDAITNNSKLKINKIPLNIKKTKEKNYSALAYSNKIVLFLPETLDENIKKEISTILVHEYFHMCLDRNPNINQLIKQCLTENLKSIKQLRIKQWDPWIIINELIVSSFVPEGHLGKLMNYNTNYKETTRLGKIRLIIGKKMQKTARQYINQKKILDIHYLEKIIKILKNELL